MLRLAKKAFTLIELLVVIAIIGILSGLIVVSMNGTTNKAAIARSQIFSNSLRNAIMLNLVAEYKLDANAYDNWGNGNGTLHGTTSVTSGCPQGVCLFFNGSSSDYINIADNDTFFNFGSKMTAMMWVKGVAQDNKVVLGQYDSGINKRAWRIGTTTGGSNNAIRVILSDNGTVDSGHRKIYNSGSVVAFDNNWHLIGFTWNSGTLNLYVDSQQVSSTKDLDDSITTIYNTDANLTIGSDLTSGSSTSNFNGSIDETRLYNESIPTSQIKEQYYSGLNELLANGNIDINEYNQRIKDISFNK